MRYLSAENPNERLRCSEGQHYSGQGHHENPLHLTPLHAPEPLSSLLARVVLLVGTRSPVVGLSASSQEASINNTRIPSLGTTASALEEPIAPPVPVKYTHLLIDGKFVNAASGKTFPRLDPRTGDLIVNVAEGDAEDMDRVVRAARKAFDEGPWPKMTAYERSCSLTCLKSIMMRLQPWKHGTMGSLMNKQPWLKCQRQCSYFVTMYGGQIKYMVLQFQLMDLISQTLHEPIRVAGGAVARHMDIDKVAFTGSTAIGQVVLELASKSNLKPVTLELGGKSPFIVCEDADVNQAVELTLHYFSIRVNAVVHEPLYIFVEKAKARRVVGDPFRKGVEQGPQDWQINS